MADILQKIKGLITGLVGIVIAFAVLIVFANILFDTGLTPIDGIIALLEQFLNNGLAGLLALVVLVWFLQD